MEWIKLTDSCKGIDDCPNVYLTDRGTAAVQGVLLRQAANGEAIVEIPLDILREATRAIE